MSTALTRDRGYRFPPAPSRAVLGREEWDFALGDVNLRLTTLEAKRTELQGLLDDLSFNGQQRIDAAISPLIVQVEARIVEVQSLIDKVITDAANAATEVTAEVRERIAAAETRLGTVEAEFNRIVAGGVAAGKVALVEIAGFAPRTVQAAIEALVSGKTEKATTQALTDRVTASEKAIKAAHFDAAAYSLAFGGS